MKKLKLLFVAFTSILFTKCTDETSENVFFDIEPMAPETYKGNIIVGGD